MPCSDGRTQRAWDAKIEHFLRHDTGFLNANHELSWQPLRKFLRSVRGSNPYADNPWFPKNDCRLLYDRIGRNGFRERKVLTDEQLFQRQVQGQDSGRATYYITDISPLCAATLGVRENPDFVHSFREYLQCHLSGETRFLALKPHAHNASRDNDWPRHIAAARKFTYEFHFRFVGLRDRAVSGPDPRHIRNWYRLIAPLRKPDRGLKEEEDYDLACYDATTSFLVIGRNERDWKAYCNTDTYFDDNMPIEKYIDDDLDAPAGDARSATDKPCMDPREYFLLILGHRLRQLSHEWGNVSSALLNRLSAYEEHYLQNIDDQKADLHDDQNLTRIRTYLKAASMLRSFHDTLSTTLRCLDAFKAKDEKDEDLFAHQDNFEDRCGCYQIIIDDQAAHLTRIKEHFFERMQRFESMRESMMAASLLRENRQAKHQSQDIELLTKVTVIYLPFSLAATVCGISEKIPPKNIAGFGLLFAMLIAVPTFMYTFNVWRGRENPPEPEVELETDDETRRESQPLTLH